MDTQKSWQEKKVSLGGSIVVAALTLVAGIFIGMNGGHVWSKFSPYLGFKNTTNSSLDWSTLDSVYYQLANNYDGALDQGALIEGAKKGLTEAVGDKYTAYMTVSEASDFSDSLHGNVGSGVGIEMGLRDGYVRVLRTLPDNPAKKAGILAGDIIYKVNGEEVYDKSTDDIASKVRGETGTEVEVTVIRDGEEKSFKMTREEINNVSAYTTYTGDGDKKTAIITVTRFDTDTGTIIQKEAKDFEKKGVKKVILDLRGNGGGYVSAARDLLSLWIDGEKVLEQKSKWTSSEITKAKSGIAILKDMKTVVLVNGSTASASEITAGALQDYKKATILGEQTYGKGVVQTLLDLEDGSLLKVTTAHWYTPNGNTIDGTGITPDKVVERTYDDINKDRDPQLDAAKKL